MCLSQLRQSDIPYANSFHMRCLILVQCDDVAGKMLAAAHIGAFEHGMKGVSNGVDESSAFNGDKVIKM